jgi:hypothetical protein
MEQQIQQAAGDGAGNADQWDISEADWIVYENEGQIIQQSTARSRRRGDELTIINTKQHREPIYYNQQVGEIDLSWLLFFLIAVALSTKEVVKTIAKT